MANAAPAIEVVLPAGLEDAVAAADLARPSGERRGAAARRRRDAVGAGRARPEVANRLGWLTIAERMLDELARARGVRRRACAADGIADVVLLGMGGSSLAPEVLRRSFAARRAARACTCSTRPTRRRSRAVQEAVDPAQHAVHRLLQVRRHDRAAVAVRALLRRCADDGAQLRRDHRPRLGPGASSRTEHGFRARLLRRPRHRRALQRAVAVRDGARRRSMGVDVARAAARAPAAPGRRRGRRLGRRAPTGCRRRVWLGAALGALARAGRDKLTFVIAAVAARPRPVARAARRRVDRQARHGHPAGRRGAARRARRLRRGPRVRATCPTSARPTPALDGARARALARRRASGDHDPDARARATSAACSCSPSSPSPSPAGASRSTRSTSPTCSRPRTRPSACSPATKPSGELPEVADADERRCARCCSARRRRSYVAIMGYVQPTRRASTRPSPSCARRSATRTRATTTFGYGPRFLHSTGQFHKGGPKTGRFLQLLHDGPRGRRDPGRALHVHDAQERAGDRRPARRCASSGLPAERVRLQGEDPASALRALTSEIKECDVTQIGFVGLGKMGGNMVHRIRRDSEHEVVAFDFDAKAVKQAVKHGAARRGLAAGARQAARAAADGVDHGARPARPTQETVDKLAKLLDRGDTIVDGGNSKWTDDKRRAEELESAGHRLRRRRRLRRRVGPGSRLLHDGRRPAESGQAAGADPRRARARRPTSRAARRSARAAGCTSAPPARGTT